MPIIYSGPLCARPDCTRGAARDGLCIFCWRLAKMFKRDLKMFAHEPLHGFHHDRADPELPWEDWEREAQNRGTGVADLFGGLETGDDEAELGPGRP